MDKNKLKDAYDIGENMAVLSGEGKVTPLSIRKQVRQGNL